MLLSKIQKLALVKQRLTAAVEEIFGLFERTIAEYEEEAALSKEEIDRQRHLLDAVLNPEVRLHRAANVQVVVSDEEDPPEQQDWSPSLDQEDSDSPRIKEEQEELWTSPEGEQLQWAEEADVIEFPFTPVPVKRGDAEEKPQSSQLHQSQTEENREAEPLASSSTEQMKTEDEGEECGVSEPARNVDPPHHVHPTHDGKTSHSSHSDTEDSDDWNDSRGPQSGLDSLKNSDVFVSDQASSIGDKQFTCSICGKILSRKANLKIHMRLHTGEKPFNCSVCGKGFADKRYFRNHRRVHTGEKPFICSVCGKGFVEKRGLRKHMQGTKLTLLPSGQMARECSSSTSHSVDYHGLFGWCWVGCEADLPLDLKVQRVHTGEKVYSYTVNKII